MNQDPAQDQTKPHSWLRIWAEIAGAWAISLAHPVYTNIASGPEALTSYGVRRLDLFLLVLLVSLAGPLVIALAELALRRLFGERVRRIVHGSVIGLLLALVLWQWLLEQTSPTIIRTLLPLALAGLVAWAYVKTELVRNFALMLSFATVFVIGVFALDYPIKEEVLPHEAKTETGKIEGDTPVVLVVFDEFPLAALQRPDGTIDPRFPNFASLARKGTWYPDAVSVADQTTFAVPSILTGQDPDPAGGSEPPSASLANYPDSICRIASDGGYEIHSYEVITDLCDRSWGLGTRLTATIRRAAGADDGDRVKNMPGDLDKKLARAASSLFRQPWPEYEAGRREAFDEFIEGMPEDPRSLSVIHIALPHIKWMYSPDGTTYEDFRPAADTMLIDPPTQAEVDRNAQQMMLQLRFTDSELGRLIAKMKADGTWDESLFVVTADHGAAFEPGGSRRLLNFENEGWIVPVPLFIKYPEQDRGKVVRGTVDGRDIAPTLMNAFGLEPVPGMTGRDLTGRESLDLRKNADVVAALGGSTAIPLDDARKQREQASRYLHRLLGRSFFAPGGHAPLLGRRPVGLREVGYQATDPSLYEKVDTRSDEIPAYFQAAISPPDGKDPGTLAIALNDRIVATTKPWELDGTWHAGVMLPTGAFRDGANEVRVYEIGSES